MAFSYRHKKIRRALELLSGNWEIYEEAARTWGTRIHLGIRNTWAWIAAWLHQLLGLWLQVSSSGLWFWFHHLKNGIQVTPLSELLRMRDNNLFHLQCSKWQRGCRVHGGSEVWWPCTVLVCSPGGTLSWGKQMIGDAAAGETAPEKSSEKKGHDDC